MRDLRRLRRAARPGLVLLSTLLAAVLVVAQGPGQQGQAPPKEEGKEGKKEEKKAEKGRGRIFTGKITMRSSRQESETASYGFKGVGEDGRVQQAALGTQPTGQDHAKVAQLASHRPAREEIEAFLAQLRGEGTSERGKSP
ncbi:MAG: hypothetical protein HY656_03130 [Acidobacteria bacterium]|nr:hypothetical protein [Acidobacteriota bacterium]